MLVLDDLKFWLTFALVAACIVFLGWNQPLRYRFMSPKEIAEEQSPSTPTPWMWERGRENKLDRGPYNESRSTSDRYSFGRYR